jgi:hypothetical protein
METFSPRPAQATHNSRIDEKGLVEQDLALLVALIFFTYYTAARYCRIWTVKTVLLSVNPILGLIRSDLATSATTIPKSL